MNCFQKGASIVLVPFIVLTTATSTARAGNGMYTIGYGTESSLMGGADVAVARDAFASNNNPAGLTQILSRVLDIEVAPFSMRGNAHTDSFGNYRKPTKNDTSIYGNVAYAQRHGDSSFSNGLSLVVQGGMGWQYSGMNTIFGTRDDASSTFSIVKLSPAFAWKVNDQWSLGLAIGFNYMAATQELFPNTSTTGLTPSPLDDFNGFRFNDASGFAINTKWGLQFRPVDDVVIGFTYTTEANIPLKGGNMRVNFTNSDIAPGLGIVRYDNAKLEGIRLPVEWALGVAFRPTAPLLVSLQYKWGNWSRALDSLRLSASSPHSPVAPSQLTIASSVDAVDLGVTEIGVAYDYGTNTMLYAGYNYARHLIPDSNLTPIFANIYTTHYTFGLKQKLDDGWEATAGIEYLPVQSRTYDNPLFGPRANERHGGEILHLGVSRRW